jgi:antitoxin component of MazEF toxin-antitoxin module
MRILKIRKVGNSQVVSIPREFASAGFGADAEVGMELGDDGLLYLKPLPPDERKQLVLRAVRSATKRHARAMQILEEYDRQPQPSAPR